MPRFIVALSIFFFASAIPAQSQMLPLLPNYFVTPGRHSFRHYAAQDLPYQVGQGCAPCDRGDEAAGLCQLWSHRKQGSGLHPGCSRQTL